MLNVETLRHLGTTDANELPKATTLSDLGTIAIYLCRICTTERSVGFNQIYTNEFIKVAKEIPKL